MHIGVIGFGYWGPNIVRALSENRFVQKISIFDLDSKRLEVAKGRSPKSNIVYSLSDILDDASVVAIVIATPVTTHYSLVEKCLSSGKHVLCEKPLSTVSNEISQLKKISQDRGLILMAGHVFEFHPVVRYMKGLIDHEELGRLFYLQFQRNGLGPIREDVSVMADLASHDISIANYLLGGVPQTISANAVSFFHNQKYDVAFIDLQYSDNIHVNIHVSWIDLLKQRNIKVIGGRKMLLFDDVAANDKIKIIEAGDSYQDMSGDFASFQYKIKDGQVIIPNIPYREPLAEEISHFIDCIHTKSAPLTGSESAFNIAKVLEAIDRSLALNGAKVEL